ncbi:WhiB family transcriptional regulator [Nonomuraea sp. B12E4]|uniref:WhiB family transcriptional regulator n=1 Tax=Nonomuraea sp. B12E4 TaxID=3153564 RepID=UPI00325DEBB8
MGKNATARPQAAGRPSWGWQDDAACRGENLLLFFGPDGERQPERDARERKAKAICDRCPVRRRCAETAFVQKLDNGVWGGFGEQERVGKRRTWLKNTAVERRLTEGRVSPPAEKLCRGCEETKPAADFPKDRMQPDGLNRTCKGCANKAGRDLRARQRDARQAVA